MRPTRRRDEPAAWPTASTHVSDVGLDLGPVHVVGRQVGGGSEDSISIWRFLVLFFLQRKIIEKSEINMRAVTNKAT